MLQKSSAYEGVVRLAPRRQVNPGERTGHGHLESRNMNLGAMHVDLVLPMDTRHDLTVNDGELQLYGKG